MNELKTMYMKISRNMSLTEASFIIGDHNFPVCHEFKYLGAVVTEVNDITTEIKARITVGNAGASGRFKKLSDLEGSRGERSSQSIKPLFAL